MDNTISDILEAVNKIKSNSKDKAIESVSNTPVKESIDLVKIAKKLAIRNK